MPSIELSDDEARLLAGLAREDANARRYDSDTAASVRTSQMDRLADRLHASRTSTPAVDGPPQQAHYLVTFVIPGPGSLKFASIEIRRAHPLAYGESVDLVDQVAEAIDHLEPGTRPILQGVFTLAADPLVDSRGRPCRIEASDRAAYLLEDGTLMWPEDSGWDVGTRLDVQVLIPVEVDR